MEQNKTIPFFDILINHIHDSLSVSIYRKSSNSGLYLNFRPNHPASTKTIGLVKILHQRVLTISLNSNIKKLGKVVACCIRMDTRLN